MNSQTRSVFLSIGFRPFYLGAGVFAAISVPTWISANVFSTPLPTSYPVYLWHAHEMLFGFAVAVIAGFLLTAVRNWTDQATPSGPALAVLFGLWVSGRVAPFVGSDLLFALVDSTFLPWLALCLAVPIWRARNLRNAFVIVVLFVLWVCNVTFHAAVLGGISTALIQPAITVAADVVLLLMIVIGGRIIPAFSANAVPGLQPRSWPILEATSIGLVLLIVVLDVVRPAVDAPIRSTYSILLYVAAVAHLLRLIGWRPWRTRSNVLLLVLPLSYLWIPIHLLLRGYFGGAPGVLTSLAAHALFVGAMAGLMLSMMTRSALGHTGRPLQAGWAEIACFAFIQLAALLRVGGPWFLPDHQGLLIVLSALFWCAAFVTFVVTYAPILAQPRITQDSAATIEPIRVGQR